MTVNSHIFFFLPNILSNLLTNLILYGCSSTRVVPENRVHWEYFKPSYVSSLEFGRER